MLLDTSGLQCLHHAAELQHKTSVTFFDTAAVRLTHSYVLAEFVALAHARRLPRSEVLTYIPISRTAPRSPSCMSRNSFTERRWRSFESGLTRIGHCAMLSVSS